MNCFLCSVFCSYPPPQEDIDWQSYYEINDNVITPYYMFTKRYFSDSDFHFGYKYIECDHLWYNYIKDK